jgi:hypothetical protein
MTEQGGKSKARGRQLFPSDRLEVWYDGSAICLIAVGAYGDPLDLGESEVRALIERLRQCLAEAEED